MQSVKCRFCGQDVPTTAAAKGTTHCEACHYSGRHISERFPIAMAAMRRATRVSDNYGFDTSVADVYHTGGGCFSLSLLPPEGSPWEVLINTFDDGDIDLPGSDAEAYGAKYYVGIYYYNEPDGVLTPWDQDTNAAMVALVRDLRDAHGDTNLESDYSAACLPGLSFLQVLTVMRRIVRAWHPENTEPEHPQKACITCHAVLPDAGWDTESDVGDHGPFRVWYIMCDRCETLAVDEQECPVKS